MSHSFEPAPHLPESSQKLNKQAQLVLAYAKQQYQRLAKATGPDVAESEFGNVAFYLATKWGLQDLDPIIINDNAVMRHLPSLGGRELRYMELSRQEDSYEVDLSAETYDASTIADKTMDGVPNELRLISLKETPSGITLGGMPLDLAVSLDRTGGMPEHVEGPYLNKMLKIMQLVDVAPYTKN